MDRPPRFELIRHGSGANQVGGGPNLAFGLPASPVHYQFNPVKTAKTNFLGTYNMLGLARGWGLGCFWLAPVRFMAIQVHPQQKVTADV